MIAAAAQLALAMAITGANVPVGKILAGQLPIFGIVFLRCLVAVAVLVPLVRILEPKVPRPDRRLALNLAMQAALGTVLYNFGLLAGLRLTSALEAGLVLASMPAVVALGAAALLGETLRPGQWGGVALAALGMAALHLAGLAETSGAGGFSGNALVFLGVCGEAGYALLSKRSAGATGVFTATLWMQVFSCLLLAPLALPDLLALPGSAFAPWVLGLVALHGLTASVLHLLLWYRGMRTMKAGLAGVFAIFLPAAATLASMALLGERPGLAHGIGFALMVLSVLAATWPSKAGPKRTARAA